MKGNKCNKGIGNTVTDEVLMTTRAAQEKVC